MSGGGAMKPGDQRYKALVEHVDIFKGLDVEDVEKIFSRGMTMRVQKGDTIFHKDTVGNQMYVILGGQVGIYDGPKLLNTLNVGDTFGEMSLLNNAKRSATAVALEMCNLLSLSEELFQKLLTKKVAVQMLMNLSKMMAKRLADSNLKLRESEGR